MNVQVYDDDFSSSRNMACNNKKPVKHPFGQYVTGIAHTFAHSGNQLFILNLSCFIIAHLGIKHVYCLYLPQRLANLL